MRSEQVRSNRGRADSKHTWIGKVDLNVSVACMVHRLVLAVGGTGIGGLGDPFLAADPLRVSSSGPTASRQATSKHRPHRRSARTVSASWVASPARPPDRRRQVAAEPATQAGQGTRRHPVEEAEAKVGPTERTWRSSPVAWALPERWEIDHVMGEQEPGQASPTFTPSAMLGSRPTTNSVPSLYQIHRLRPSTLSCLARPGWLILGRRRPSVLRRGGGELRDVATCSWNR